MVIKVCLQIHSSQQICQHSSKIYLGKTKQIQNKIIFYSIHHYKPDLSHHHPSSKLPQPPKPVSLILPCPCPCNRMILIKYKPHQGTLLLRILQCFPISFQVLTLAYKALDDLAPAASITSSLASLPLSVPGTLTSLFLRTCQPLSYL